MSNTSEVHDEDQKHEVVEEEDRTDEDTLDIRPSIFHLLDDRDSEIDEPDVPDMQNVPESVNAGSTIGKKKKAKKKKKAAEKEATREEESSDTDIESLVQSIRRTNVSLQKTPPSSDSEKTLFKIDKRYFNYEAELRKLFGSRIVKSLTTSISRRDPRVRSFEKATKGFVLSQPVNPHWLRLPRADISMQLYHEKDAPTVNCFRFRHEPAYIQQQFEYFDATRSHDPSFYSSILQRHPLHVGSLLAMADVLMYQGNYAEATELVGRALYALEGALHASFRLLEDGLDYRIYENRDLFLALFKHIELVGRKGCWKSAFSFCKLLLQVSHFPANPADRDPLGVILSFDFYALQAHEYEVLKSTTYKTLCTRGSEEEQLVLPSYYYSVALAHFLDGSEEAYVFLYEALLNYPLVAKLLLLDRAIVGGLNETEEALLAVFSDTINDAPEHTINLLQHIYVQRGVHIWKQPHVATWLKDTLVTLLQQNTAVHMAEDVPTDVSPLQHLYVYRHLLLSNFSELKMSIPRALRAMPVASYDPFPPLDSSYASYYKEEFAQTLDALSLLQERVAPAPSLLSRLGDVLGRWRDF